MHPDHHRPSSGYKSHPAALVLIHTALHSLSHSLTTPSYTTRRNARALLSCCCSSHRHPIVAEVDDDTATPFSPLPHLSRAPNLFSINAALTRALLLSVSSTEIAEGHRRSLHAAEEEKEHDADVSDHASTREYTYGLPHRNRSTSSPRLQEHRGELRRNPHRSSTAAPPISGRRRCNRSRPLDLDPTAAYRFVKWREADRRTPPASESRAQMRASLRR